MATNRLLRLFLAFLILAGIAVSLQAQSAGYFIDTESGETRFVQRLVWTGGEYALRYEVVIEREVGETRAVYLRRSTEAHFLDVSLPPGNYRFQVTSYNILDRVEGVSQWEDIVIRPAVQPVVSDTSLELTSDDRYVLNITGENLDPGAVFIIRNSDGTQIIPELLSSDEDGNVSLFIESDSFTPGEYDLIVKNPGGLEAGRRGIVFPRRERREVVSESEPEVEEVRRERTPRQPITMFLLGNVVWAPIFPVHGSFYGTNASFAGFGARLGAAFPIPLDLCLGAEFTAFWNLVNNAVNDDSYDIMSLGGNLLVLKWLPNQTMALKYRLGLSFVLQPELQDKLSFNIGASYLWRFYGMFTLEAGLDYTTLIQADSFDGGIRPWIGVGILRRTVF